MQTPRWIPTALAAIPIALVASHSAVAVTFTVSSGGSIAAALGGAVSGDSVLVAAGRYVESITLRDGVQLLGGFDATFDPGARDPQAHRTIISGNNAGSTVLSGPTVSASTLVDGFVITGGSGDAAAGIKVNGGAPVFSNNEISGNRRGIAGGAYVFGGSATTFRDNLVRDNSSAGSGGGIRVEQSPVTLIDNTFRDNVAPNSGGGLYVFQSSVYCSSNTFQDNRVGEGGGGVYLQEAGTGSRFADNEYLSCEAMMGGGVHAKNATFVTMERETFTSCSATSKGGAVAVTAQAELTLVDCVMDACTATTEGGGAWVLNASLFYFGTLDGSAQVTSRIENCTAGDFGGGISTEVGTGVFDNLQVTNCSSTQWGGGLYLLHSEMVLTECIVEDCTAGEGGGIAFRAISAADLMRSQLTSCTVYGCSATGTPEAAPHGGGLTLAAMGNEVVATCAGNIVAGTLIGTAVRCRRGGPASGTGTPVITCSSFHADPSNPVSLADLVFGNRCNDAFNFGVNNQEGLDPLFCQPIVNYQLQDTSPEAGSNCVAGKTDRGAYRPDGIYCTGPIVSLQRTSWGHLKAMYR